MKILSISDKENSAIDRLCQMNVRRMSHLQIAHLSVHPKKPESAQLDAFARLLKSADLVDCQYYKTAVMLLDKFPEMAKKKLVLTAHNEHMFGADEAWRAIKWDAIVAKNGWQLKQLQTLGHKPVLIRHAVEMNQFPFMPQLTKEKVVGYVGQIKKVKGVRELKRACDELGYRLLIVGNPSESQYWAELNKENLFYFHDVPDHEMHKMYHSMRIFCANSDDGTESGTLPILEAMSAGVPILTRKIGLVRDCGEHEKNMLIRQGRYDDIEDLKTLLKFLMENDDVAESLRESAWRTVRQYHADIQAREYERLWRKVLYGNDPCASVIIPTFERPEALAESLEAISEQSWHNIEAVVVDDSLDPEKLARNKAVVEEARKLYGLAIRYETTGKKEPAYGLAKARNLGVVAAIGDILVFCDDRLRMRPGSVESFVRKLQADENKKTYLWGSKGVFKSFVENFSAIRRRQFIDAGLFNERINEYGGTTQELSGRFAAQGFKFEWCPEALAEPTVKTHSRSANRDSIVRMKIRLYKLGFQ